MQLIFYHFSLSCLCSFFPFDPSGTQKKGGKKESHARDDRSGSFIFAVGKHSYPKTLRVLSRQCSFFQCENECHSRECANLTAAASAHERFGVPFANEHVNNTTSARNDRPSASCAGSSRQPYRGPVSSILCLNGAGSVAVSRCACRACLLSIASAGRVQLIGSRKTNTHIDLRSMIKVSSEL